MSKISTNALKIWVDGYEANVEQRLGSSQVAFELIKHFEKLDHQNDYTILLPDKPLGDLPKIRSGWKYKILKPKRLWTQITLPLALYTSRPKPDLIFSPTHYIPRFSPTKRVVTIFDLSFLHFPEMFNNKDLWQLKNWTKYSIENADHIITISKYSRKDIINQYAVDRKKITVAYPGYNREIFHPIMDKEKIAKVLKKYGIKNNYIIYIGTIQPRKNLIRLIDAISKVDNLNLVIVGKTSGLGRQGWMFEDILKKPKELMIEDKVKFLGFVPTSDLPYLLCGSLGLVQPSLYEGFGITVLEALACGIPVVVSNVSALPEVVGKAGIFFDPYSTDQMEQAIRILVSDKKIRQKYINLAIERAKNFSWEKMAQIVLMSFKHCLT